MTREKLIELRWLLKNRKAEKIEESEDWIMEHSEIYWIGEIISSIDNEIKEKEN